MRVIDVVNSRWTSLSEKPFANGINWDGDEPVPDINTDRRLFIKKSSEKMGIANGSYQKGYLCEFKRKGMKTENIFYSHFIDFCSLQGQHLRFRRGPLL